MSLLLCLIMFVIARRTRRGDYAAVGDVAPEDAELRTGNEGAYQRLRNVYLSVYALATFGDWIQGGFLYALYAEYGYTTREIALIFVVGYTAAATIGTYVAALGDTGGHRRNCVAYGILYAFSCLLCNFRSLGMLLFGRVLSGIAYSILYTSFESWLIAEADARRVPLSSLSRLFSVATFTNAVRVHAVHVHAAARVHAGRMHAGRATRICPCARSAVRAHSRYARRPYAVSPPAARPTRGPRVCHPSVRRASSPRARR